MSRRHAVRMIQGKHLGARRGVTLIEVLIAVVISAIAMFALVPPFLAEGNLFRKGKRQTEAQRDAQLALRAMARVARQSQSYTVPSPGPNSAEVDFSNPPGLNPLIECFRGGPAFNGGQLQLDDCGDPPTPIATLIDGNRSKVASLTFTRPIAGSSKLVRVRLQVTHRLRTTDTRTETELLETELFLRNGT